MTILNTLDECVNHLVMNTPLDSKEYAVVAKYIEDHKYFLEKQWKKSISWDASYNSFREYVYSPISSAIRMMKIKETLNLTPTQALLGYIDTAQKLSDRFSRGYWFTPTPTLVCNYILWKFYYEKVALGGTFFDKIKLWWYGEMTSDVRRDQP